MMVGHLLRFRSEIVTLMRLYRQVDVVAYYHGVDRKGHRVHFAL